MPDKIEGEGFVMQEAPGEKTETDSENRKDSDQPPVSSEINFSTFILSMSSSVMLSFGDIPDPISGKKEKNLPMAKQTIDILTMLQKKTVNNLSADEEKLLEDLLADLKLRYVDIVKREKAA